MDVTARPGRLARRLGGIALVAALGAYLAASLLLPATDAVMGFFRTYVHNVLMVAAAAIAATTAVRAERERRAWTVIALGLAAFAGGEIVWRLVYSDDASPPSPSWADALWLTTYPAFYVGLMLVVRARVAAFAAGAWLDGLIASMAVAAIGVAFYLVPLLEDSDASAVALAVTMAYPLGDLLLWVLLLAALALSGWRLSRGLALLVAGQVAITVGDAMLAIQTASGTYVEGRWSDATWPLGALLIAAAGLERAPSRPVVPLAGWRSIAIPAAFVAIAAVLQVLDGPLRFPIVVDVLISATFLLVLVRAGLALRDNQRLLERSQAEATTDALTGLGNRRALFADLADAVEGGGRRTLALFDLDGFKAYNDTFGHDAGDALLARLGAALAATVAPGRAYRFGGDEFCVLTPLTGPGAEAALAQAGAALGEEGWGYSVGASCGAALVPDEAADATTALRLVDQRMYAHKRLRRTAGVHSGEVAAFRAVVAEGATRASLGTAGA